MRIDSWHCHALKSKRQKNADDTTNVMFETTLELIQNISVTIRKASPEYTPYVGDCHECCLYCYKCFSPFGIKGTIFQVLYEAPYAILYHYGLELPKIEKMIHQMIDFMHHFQCTQGQKILMTVELKSSNVKLHILHVHVAMAIIWKITRISSTID